jgi:hypothetical protein
MFDKWKRQLPSGEWVRIKRLFRTLGCFKCDFAGKCEDDSICRERDPYMNRTYLKKCKPPKGRG